MGNGRKPYPLKVRERAVRLVYEWRAAGDQDHGGFYEIGEQLGIHGESIRNSDRLADEGTVTSVGSKGDSYDNAMAESINAFYKAELITMQDPWRNVDDVELATLGWVHWWNHRRLLASTGNIPPVEFETRWTTTQPADNTDHHDARPGVLT